MFDITKLRYKDIIDKTFYVIVGMAFDDSNQDVEDIDDFEDVDDFFLTPQKDWISCCTGSTCGESLDNIATFETIDEAKSVVNSLKSNPQMLTCKDWDDELLKINSIRIIPYILTDDDFKTRVVDKYDNYQEKLLMAIFFVLNF